MRDMSNISWLTDLYLASQGAAGPQDRQQAIDAILQHIVQGFGGLTGCLAVQQRASADGLTIVSVIALPAEVVGHHVAPGEGILGRVRQTARAVVINGDARADARFDQSGDATAALRRRPRSALCWPLLVKGQVIGVLSINRSDALDPFTTEDLERGASAVALLALVVDNWQMHTYLQERVDGLSAMNAEIQAANHRLADAQHQLLQSEKMASIGQLAAGVAHEINNPIGYVSSNLQTLSGYSYELLGLVDRLVARSDLAPQIAASGVDVEFLRQDMAALIRESRQGLDRVKQIVRDLKDFSRVDQTEDWQGADRCCGRGLVRHRRQRLWYCAGQPGAYLRALLHHQAGGQGHRAGPVAVLLDRAQAPRAAGGCKRARARDAVPAGPAGAPDASGGSMGSMNAMPAGTPDAAPLRRTAERGPHAVAGPSVARP